MVNVCKLHLEEKNMMYKRVVLQGTYAMTLGKHYTLHIHTLHE